MPCHPLAPSGGITTNGRTTWTAHAAASGYQRLADDDRLSRRDRTRALLWVGTALDKHGDHSRAITAMSVATATFEMLDEAADWCVGQQKLALAARSAGDLDTALRHLGQALGCVAEGSPLQGIRLQSARGHILLSNPSTRSEGARLLDDAEQRAHQHGLGHQARVIHTIRTSFEEGSTA